MDPTLWDLFHDATLAGIAGAVPGDLSLKVDIPYLRERFPSAGEGFVVLLRGCTQFTYEPYEGSPTSDLAAIEALELWILGAEPGDPMPIACGDGTLLVHFASAQIKLENGIEVSLSELEDASQGYWREWSGRYGSAL